MVSLLVIAALERTASCPLRAGSHGWAWRSASSPTWRSSVSPAQRRVSFSSGHPKPDRWKGLRIPRPIEGSQLGQQGDRFGGRVAKILLIPWA